MLSLRRSSVLVSLALCLTPVCAFAQSAMIEPSLVNASTQLESALQTHKGHASTNLEGAGGKLTINYQSSEPLEVYMVPLAANGSYVPTDFIHFTLPMTEQGTVTVDLTVSPGWSLRQTKWQLNLLSTDENAGAQFTSVSFDDTSLPLALTAAFKHLFTPEPYTPSSYHALYGYRMLGVSFTVMFAVLILLVSIACFFFLEAAKRRSAILMILLVGALLYQARFSIDLLRFTGEHLTSYAHDGTYDEAGSIHAVADFIRSLPEKQSSVSVCRDGTNFKEKLLRYFMYPIPVSSLPEAAKTATLAVVMDKFKWGFDALAAKDSPAVHLKCGDIDRDAIKLATFPDGTIVFQLQPS